MQTHKIFGVLSLLLLSMPFVAADIGDVFATGSDLIDYMIQYSEFTSFIILFTILTALFVIGVTKIKGALGWTGNAPTVLAVTLSLAASFASWLALDRGSLLFTEAFGRMFALLVIATFLAILGYVFHKQGAQLTGFKFLYVPLAILVFYYVLDAILPDFKEGLGSELATIIEIVIAFAWIALVIGGGIWLWNTFIAPLSGLKAKTPLTPQQLLDTKEAIKQKREIVAEEAASKARKEERNVRRDLRKISYKIKEARNILSELTQEAAQKDQTRMKGNWKKWKGELKKLKGLTIEISAYAALVSKVLAETTSLPGLNPANKTKLETFESGLLAEGKKIELAIEEITVNLQVINKSTPPGAGEWIDIIRSISDASNLFKEILRLGEGALALEQKVREDLGRA